MKDSIVEQVRQDLLDRSNVGINKYNNTLDRNDLDLVDWLEHARQEAMDFSLYLTRAKKDVQELQDQYDDVVREYFKAIERCETLRASNDEYAYNFEIKERIIETLNKVIFSQEQEIKELRNQEYYDKKRRAWHY